MSGIRLIAARISSQKKKLNLYPSITIEFIITSAQKKTKQIKENAKNTWSLSFDAVINLSVSFFVRRNYLKIHQEEHKE